MTGAVTIGCLVIALVLVLVTGTRAALDRATTRADLAGAGLLEVGVLLYTILRVIDLAGGHRTSGLPVVIAYLAGLLLVMPIAAVLSWAEPTRWGSVIMGSGALVVCVMFGRVNELWTPHG